MFFSGGTALRPLSRALKLLTYNSVHVVTPFDSGGSSAKLRTAFGMPAVGDLRNRLMALADETDRGNPATHALFSHRLPEDADDHALRAELTDMIEKRHPLVAAVPRPFRLTVRTHLRQFADHMPDGFDLRGASVGNLVLAGGYLENGRDLRAVLALFSSLATVRGLVIPVVDADHHLAATLADGTEIVGQHRITRRDVTDASPRIADLHLVRSLEDPRPVEAVAGDDVIQTIRSADLIVFPMGSFWTSVVANLLPKGIGRAIAAADCEKLYVKNAGRDPEQVGMSTADCVAELTRRITVDGGDGADLTVLEPEDSPRSLAEFLVSRARPGPSA